jgi:O-antigen ligase
MGNIYLKILNHNIWSEGKITYFFAICTMIAVPIYVKFLTPCMILWCISWVIENRNKLNVIKQSELSFKVLFIISLSFYIWQLIGVFYSDNNELGWNNMIKRISMAIFPVILISPGRKIKQNIKVLLQIFCVSTFIFILFCFGYATFKSVGIQDGIFTFNPHLPIQKWLNYYYGINFAIYQHPSYLSMYILLSVFIAFESFFDISINKIQKFFWLTISLVLLISIYLLSARAGLLATIILLPVYLFLKTFVRKKYIVAVIFILIEIFILLPVVLKNQRVSLYMKSISGKSLVEMVNRDGRIIIWKAALRIVQKNLIIGVGTGDVNAELVNEYYRIGNKELIAKKFNVHNQFIEVLLENGIIGFALFMSILGMMLYIAISKRNLIYLMFILIICVFFLFESMLYRLGGIAFFALLYFLILHLNSKTDSSFTEITDF